LSTLTKIKTINFIIIFIFAFISQHLNPSSDNRLKLSNLYHQSKEFDATLVIIITQFILIKRTDSLAIIAANNNAFFQSRPMQEKNIYKIIIILITANKKQLKS